jgi:hypothetical protein
VDTIVRLQDGRMLGSLQTEEVPGKR